MVANITTIGLATRLGFNGPNDPDYVEHVRSVKYEFLRRDNDHLLAGPQSMKRLGQLAAWEIGIDRLCEAYPELWGEDRFSADLGARHDYANYFLVNQAKKARADMAVEAKQAEEAAQRARREEEKARKAGETTSQRARGRKRAFYEPGSTQSSPTGRRSSALRYSSTPRGSSPPNNSSPPPPKKRKAFEGPDLQFKSFLVLLKKGATFAQNPYLPVSEFGALLKWILSNNPTHSGKPIVCWTEITMRDTDYAKMRDLALNDKIVCFISDQSTWDAALMSAQLNHPKADQFSGISLKVALATDTTAPPHEEGDDFVLEDPASAGTTGGDTRADGERVPRGRRMSARAEGELIVEDENLGERGKVDVGGEGVIGGSVELAPSEEGTGSSSKDSK